GELAPEERAKMDASLAEASAVLGVDVRQELLQSLGDRMALWSTAKAGPLPIPDAGASITLTDGARASELLGRLIEGIELGPDVAIRPFELEGATAAWSSSGAMLVSPAWAVVGDRLLAATNGPLLRRTMQANGAAGVVADADF